MCFHNVRFLSCSTIFSDFEPIPGQNLKSLHGSFVCLALSRTKCSLWRCTLQKASFFATWSWSWVALKHLIRRYEPKIILVKSAAQFFKCDFTTQCTCDCVLEGGTDILGGAFHEEIETQYSSGLPVINKEVYFAKSEVNDALQALYFTLKGTIQLPNFFSRFLKLVWKADSPRLYWRIFPTHLHQVLVSCIKPLMP